MDLLWHFKPLFHLFVNIGVNSLISIISSIFILNCDFNKRIIFLNVLHYFFYSYVSRLKCIGFLYLHYQTPRSVEGFVISMWDGNGWFYGSQDVTVWESQYHNRSLEKGTLWRMLSNYIFGESGNFIHCRIVIELTDYWTRVFSYPA